MADYGSTTKHTGSGEAVSPVQQFMGPGDLERLSDEELIRRYCAHPPDREAGEELSRRCLPRLERLSRWKGGWSGLCPAWHSEGLFCEEVFSRANEDFTKGICSFRFEGPLDGWLATLVENAAITEYRKLVGRALVPRRFEPIERPEEEDEADAPPLSHAKDLTADDHPLFRSKYLASPAELVRDRELREIVTILLTMHGQISERSWRSANAIRLCLWDDRKAREVADQFDTSVDNVWKFMSIDYKKLRELLRGRFGISEIRDL